MYFYVYVCHIVPTYLTSFFFYVSVREFRVLKCFIIEPYLNWSWKHKLYNIYFLIFSLYRLHKTLKTTLGSITIIIVVIAILLSTFLAKTAVLDSMFESCVQWSSLSEPYIWHSALVQALMSTQIVSGYLTSAGGTIYRHSDVRW